MKSKGTGLRNTGVLSTPLPPKLDAPNPSTLFGSAMPVGSVIAFAGEIRTSGDKPHETNLPMFNWLKCDGVSLNVADYPELFCALGYRYGGSGQCFSLPDLRGEFLRGVDDERQRAGSLEDRTAAAKGETSGVGSTQEFAFQSHTHKYQKPTSGSLVVSELGSPTTSVLLHPTSTQGEISGNVSQQETRPVNTFVYWLIKTQL